MPFSKDFEFRSIQKEQKEEFNNLVKYVFADGSVEDEEEDELLQSEWTTAAFHKGKIVATAAGFPFKMRFNGQANYTDGVTAVGTDPGFRRRGLVRELITRRLHEVHEHPEQSTAILWASMGAIYQRFGYGLGSTQANIKFDPRFAQFQFSAEPKGYVRLVEEEEGKPIIHSLYRSFIEPRTLALHRSDKMWRGAFGTKKRRSYCAVYFNDQDHPEGYLTFGTREYSRQPEGGGPDQRLNVKDYVYQNIHAFRALWEFIRSHDLVGEVEYSAPLDDPAFNMLLEPRVLRVSLSDAIWLRIVDVAQTLASRNYAMPSSFCFEIKEDIECPWNIRKYLVETDGMTTEVNKTRRSPQFTITQNGLASLMSGNQSLTQLDRMGRATVNDRKQLVNLDTIFSTLYKPFCNDGF